MENFAIFWEHICHSCGKTTPKIIKHHVSYFPEYLIPMCKACHFALTHFGKKSHLVKYTSEDYQKFYRKYFGLGDKNLEMAANFLSRIESLYQLETGLKDEVLLQSRDFFHLSELLQKICCLPYYDVGYNGGYSFWILNTRYKIDLGEDHYYEEDDYFRTRYGNPNVSFICDIPVMFSYLSVHRPGRFKSFEEIYDVKLLADAFRERIPQPKSWNLRLLDIESFE